MATETCQTTVRCPGCGCEINFNGGYTGKCLCGVEAERVMRLKITKPPSNSADGMGHSLVGFIFPAPIAQIQGPKILGERKVPGFYNIPVAFALKALGTLAPELSQWLRESDLECLVLRTDGATFVNMDYLFHGPKI